MLVPVTPTSHPHRFLVPHEPGRRQGAWSLLMVAVTPVAFAFAGTLGVVFQRVVFDVQEQQLLTEAGFWGYVAAVFLAALIVLPSLVGIVFGVRARKLGARRLGLTGVVVNGLIAAYFLSVHLVTLVVG